MVNPVTFLKNIPFYHFFRVEKLLPFGQNGDDAHCRNTCSSSNEFNGNRLIDGGECGYHREFILKPALLVFVSHASLMIFVIVLQVAWQILQVEIFVLA